MREKYLAQLGEKLGAPAEEFGIYSRPGGMSTAVSYSVSDGLGMFSNSEGKKASGGLPMNVILALTAAELVVFEMKAGMTGSLKLAEPLRRWPRSAVRAEIAGRARRAPACGSRSTTGASSSTPTSCRAWTSSGTCSS